MSTADRETGRAPADDAELAQEPKWGIPTEAKLFYGIGTFSAVLGVIYWVTTSSYGGAEFAGVLALLAGAGFSFFFGTFLTLTLRRVQNDFEALEELHAAGDPAANDVLFLPAESIWPIGLGVGLSLILTGIPLGMWVLIPGLALFTHSLIGFARQSIDRH